MKNTLTAPDDGVMLLDACQAAAMCGLSRSAWYKLAATGKAPRPVKLGRSTRWSRAELERWIAAGCPTRDKWSTATK